MRKNLSSFFQLRVNVLIYQILGWRIGPLYIAFLQGLYFFFKRKERQKIRWAVKSLLAERKGERQIKYITQGVFQGIRFHYCEKLFNAFSSSGKLRDFLRVHFESEGMGAIEKGLSKGKGVLLVSGHFGGIEFIPGYLAANNYPVTIVARFSSNYLRDVSIQKAREFGANLVDADQAPNIMRAIMDSLKENRIVITLCDEVDEWRPSRTDKISFLGKQIGIDRAVDVLVKRGEASLVFGIMHRHGNQGNNNHRYKFSATSREDVEKQFHHSSKMPLGALLLKFLEHYIYKYPEQWYQWQKYTEIEALPFHAAKVGDPKSLSLLEPSLDKIA